MKIALVLSRAPGYSETFFRSKITGLLGMGFEVELFVDHREVEFELCKQHVLPGSNLFNFLPALFKLLMTRPGRVFSLNNKLKKDDKNFSERMKCIYSCLHLLRSDAVDWVHFGFATISLGREHIAHVIGAKMAVSLRGFDITRYPLKNPGCYRYLWQEVDRVHVISRALLDDAHRHGLPGSADFRRISPAINISQFPLSKSNHSIHNPVQLLTVARLHWVKGIEYTFEALVELKKSGYNFIYTLIGDGGEHDRLVLAADQLGIYDQVRFIGKLPHQELNKYYLNTDIYLQYSVQEGFCNAVLEAQAVGIPCIVSDAGGLPENVIHNETGWVVPRRNPALFAEKIIEVIKMDPGRLQQVGERAREHVKNNFNIEKQYADFFEFYNN